MIFEKKSADYFGGKKIMSTFAAVSEILLWYGCKADRE